ncbi:hypothetical protein [Deinococcus hohokamensis]|uniref:Uncharacterized protein n=1 Tax=Deinococcus hohokamensis TaxID=309883 RepID=A0ABV9IFJ4_9DEIO
MKSVFLAPFLLIGLATAQGKTTTVYFNGQPIQGVLVTEQGKTYVKLPYAALQQAGALVEGGSQPITAIQGCAGQTLFNGVNRVTLLEAGVKAGEYRVKVKIANGTNKQINPASDADMMSYNWYAASADGQVEPFNTWADHNSPNRPLTPGANLTAEYVLKTPPTFEVTRILYRPEANTVKNGRLSGLPFAPISNMEFAVKCKPR